MSVQKVNVRDIDIKISTFRFLNLVNMNFTTHFRVFWSKFEYLRSQHFINIVAWSKIQSCHLTQTCRGGSFRSRYSRMNQVKFVELSLKKVWSDIVSLSRPYHFKIFKDCHLQILLDPFLDTLTHYLYFSWKSISTKLLIIIRE